MDTRSSGIPAISRIQKISPIYPPHNHSDSQNVPNHKSSSDNKSFKEILSDTCKRKSKDDDDMER